MPMLHLAPLAYEAGGVQQLLRGVAVQRRERIFNVSDELDEHFSDDTLQPRIVATPRWCGKSRLLRSLSLGWHVHAHRSAMAWDDLSAWRQASKHCPDAMLYDHGVSMRNRGHRGIEALWRRVRHVVACSTAQASYIQSNWPTEANIVVCLNGLPRSFPVPAKRPDRSSTNGRRIKIGMIARLSFEKGHGVMLHALKCLRSMGIDAELVIVGTGALNSAISALIDRLGLGRHVSMRGYVESPSCIYRELDIVCLPSLWESFGLAAIEAGAYGCPVVAVDRGGLAEATGAGGILVRPTRNLATYWESFPSLAPDQQRTRFDAMTADEPCVADPGDFAEAIVSIVTSDTTYETLSRDGFHRVTTQFTFNAYLDRLNAILDRR